MARKVRKTYVEILAWYDLDGNIHPLSIRWIDGHIFHIENVVYACCITDDNSTQSTTRYTVTIKGKQTYLFFDTKRWYVEAK